MLACSAFIVFVFPESKIFAYSGLAVSNVLELLWSELTPLTSESLECYLIQMHACLCSQTVQLWASHTMSTLTHTSLTSFLWDIGKQYSPRRDAAFCGVPSGAILFAENFHRKME